MNRHFVFVGPERPKNVKIGHEIEIPAIEHMVSAATHYLKVTINHVENLTNHTIYKGNVFYDNHSYLAEINLSGRNPAKDTIVLYPN